MHLSVLLFGARSTPGKQWIGKHRKVWKMTAMRRRNSRDRQQAVREVEAVLSQPYLTREEEHRHAVERRKSCYVPLYLRQSRNKWVKREQAVFTALKN